MVMFTGVSCSIRGLYLYGYINVILISKVASLLLLFIFVLIFNVVRWTRQCPPGRICQWFLTPRPWVFLPGPDFEEKGLLRWVQPGRPTTRLVVSCCWPLGVSHPLEREACSFKTAQTGAVSQLQNWLWAAKCQKRSTYLDAGSWKTDKRARICGMQKILWWCFLS